MLALLKQPMNQSYVEINELETDASWQTFEKSELKKLSEKTLYVSQVTLATNLKI